MYVCIHWGAGQANLQMLVMLSMRDPQLLHQLGVSQQQLQREVEKDKAAGE